jgi:hypothetical protein
VAVLLLISTVIGVGSTTLTMIDLLSSGLSLLSRKSTIIAIVAKESLLLFLSMFALKAEQISPGLISRMKVYSF